MTTRTTPSLISTLLPEAFQTEESAASHCGREADRLGSAPPGLAMRALAEHAKSALAALPALARARGASGATAGSVVGRFFSNVRNFGTDLVISAEKSYRGTVLGIHHGLGLFLLLEDAAVAEGDQELADFCGAWLAERTLLVAEAERDLAWFAANPDRALRRATPAQVLRSARAAS